MLLEDVDAAFVKKVSNEGELYSAEFLFSRCTE
jgi:hypothetical protein